MHVNRSQYVSAVWIPMVVAILVLFVATPRGLAQTNAPATTIRIGAWNMLNLFDNDDDPTKPDEGTEPKSFIEMLELAKAIDGLDLDILGVEEVENRMILEKLNACLAKPFAFVELIEGNDTRGIDVGILSRFPIDRAASHRLMNLDNGVRFARDFPLFRVRPTPGTAIEIGVCHLKSKLGKAAESDAWRAAEAKAVRAILEEAKKAEPDVPQLIMGDFNDYRTSAPLAPLFAYLDDQTLLVPEKDRWSFIHEKPEQIDFILTSKDFKATRANIQHFEDNASDHSPVWAEFAWKEAPARVVVPAGSAPAAPARPTIVATDLGLLEKQMLKEVRVTGKVVQVFRPKSGGALLNFHEDHKKAITVFIPKDAEHRFGKAEDLVGKSIAVLGPVSKYKDAVQIKITRKAQIEGQ